MLFTERTTSVPEGKPYYCETAERVVKSCLAYIAMDIKCFYYPGWHTPDQFWWSLIEKDISPTPAMVSYAVLSRMVGGAIFKETLITKNLQVFFFDKPPVAAFYLYGLPYGKEGTISLSIPEKNLHLYNIMGQEIALKGNTREVTLYVREEPSYLIGRKGIKINELVDAFHKAKSDAISLEKVECATSRNLDESSHGGVWKFHEGEGSIVKDSSDNHNDGVIHNARWIKREFGFALEFDGINSYVEIPDSPTLHITQEVTVAVWAKPLANNDAGAIVVKGASIWQTSYFFRIATVSDELMTWGICTKTVESFAFVKPAPELNKWHYYVLTAKANGPSKFFIDGKLVSFLPNSPEGLFNPFEGYPIRLGISYDGAGKFKGLIGGLKILGSCLDENEVNVSSQNSKGIYI